MNRTAEKVLSIMTDAEVEQLGKAIAQLRAVAVAVEIRVVPVHEGKGQGSADTKLPTARLTTLCAGIL